MKIKILVAIFCLGLFFGVARSANAVSLDGSCGASGNGSVCDAGLKCECDAEQDCFCNEDEAAPGETIPTEFANPITADSLEDLLDSLLSTLQGLVALIAIIMLIVGGMMYMFAGVDEKMVETAKKTIGGAVIGVAIVFAAPAFLKEIQTILCGTGSTTAFCAGALDSTGVTKDALTLKEIAENILNFLLSIVGILGIIGLIVGGGFYLTAYGDEERIKKGKDIITASLTGIIIASAALIIVKQIAAIIAGE